MRDFRIVDFTARRALLCDGIDAALKALVTVPQDDAVTTLISDAQRLKRDVESWDAAPSEEELERVEQHVLSFHVAVAAMKR